MGRRRKEHERLTRGSRRAAKCREDEVKLLSWSIVPPARPLPRTIAQAFLQVPGSQGIRGGGGPFHGNTVLTNNGEPGVGWAKCKGFPPWGQRFTSAAAPETY
eukprot:751564-Hanusia_phi.AAC.1